MKLNQWQIAAIVAVLVISVAAMVYVIKGRSDQAASATSTEATTEGAAATKEEKKPAEKKKQKKAESAAHKPEPKCSATDKMLHANGC